MRVSSTKKVAWVGFPTQARPRVPWGGGRWPRVNRRFPRASRPCATPFRETKLKPMLLDRHPSRTTVRSLCIFANAVPIAEAMCVPFPVLPAPRMKSPVSLRHSLTSQVGIFACHSQPSHRLHFKRSQHYRAFQPPGRKEYAGGTEGFQPQEHLPLPFFQQEAECQ